MRLLSIALALASLLAFGNTPARCLELDAQPTMASEGSKHTKQITACGVLNSPNTTYILQNDVTSAGSCFSIQASDITLDLNGHTIAYGTCENHACDRGLGNIVAIWRTKNVVTVTLDRSVARVATRLITVSGVSDPSFNGTFVVLEKPRIDSLTLRQDGPDTPNLSGGTAATTRQRYGVIGEQCWDTEIDENPCGGPFDRLTVMNGKIVQSPNASPYSHAIRIGQGGGGELTVHNIEVTIGSPSSHAIYTTWAGGGHRIYENKIYDHVKNVINRHQLDGVAIKFEAEDSKALPNLLYGNEITGSPQGGIVQWAPKSKIYDNRISLQGRASNDFCIYVYGKGMEVYGNHCDNAAGADDGGRGLHIVSTDSKIRDNVIRVRELGRNKEYGGCESGGAYGIQIEGDKTANNEIFGNEITVIAGECDAAALRATDLKPGANNIVHDNRFQSLRATPTTKVAAGFTSADADGGLIIRHNSFATDGPLVSFVWDSASNVQWIANTIAVGPHPDPKAWYLFQFANAIPSTGTVMQDPVFVNQASDVSVALPIGHAGWGATAEYFLKWTVQVSVSDSGGNAVSGANVEIVDAKGKPEFAGTTDAHGNVSAPLTEYRRFNTKNSGLVTERLTPHTITVDKPGFAPVQQHVSVDGSKTIAVKLTAGG